MNDFAYLTVNDSFAVLFKSHFKTTCSYGGNASRVLQYAPSDHEKMKEHVCKVDFSDAHASKKEFCEHIQKHLPKLILIKQQVGKDPDRCNHVVSIAKIEATVFKTKFSLDHGIDEQIKDKTMIQNSFYGNS